MRLVGLALSGFGSYADETSLDLSEVDVCASLTGRYSTPLTPT